ncbi:MAG TPA: DUF2339 domain-containing protein [Gaiellales bacterium]|nr:DUF2339 domain-containing protein [Gaiellales bacterium]
MEDQTLRIDVQRLTRRVEQLEREVGELRGTPAADTRATRDLWADAAPRRTPAPPAAGEPSRPAVPAVPSRPAPPPPPPPPPREPMDWGALAGRVFTARTLAWAGGVATVLGIVLLFVMAASRGWVTPPMRVGIGVIVSIALLAAALELDRRSWRADAILAAAGAGIAGLYASLWASTWLYHLISGTAASPLAALIAAVAVAVAIRIHQEPLAIFGVSGAMVAPVLVSLDVTAAGLLFAAVMMAGVLPLYVHQRWSRLVAATAAVGFAESLVLLGITLQHTYFGFAAVAVATVAALLVAMALLVELLPVSGRRLTRLGGPIVSAAFTLSMADAFLTGGWQMVHGHSKAGLILLGVTLVWALLACVPAVVRRPHADLADLLAAFALAAAATATGLLAGGPALVCAWSAESAALVGLAERIARRSGVRRRRLTAAAGVYLGLASIAAFVLVQPTAEHLPHIGAGSWPGSLALAAIAIAGIVFCFGLRFIERQARDAAWAVPAVAIGYLPAWALAPEWAVAAYAGLAAALFLYRRSPAMVSWLGDEAAIVIATGWWLAGAGLALSLTAPARDLMGAGWAGLGARNGLAGLAALGLAAAVGAWSVRRPRRAHVELAGLVPVAVTAYLVAEALAAPYAMWAWLGLAGALAAVVHVPPVRRRVGELSLVLGSAGLLGLGLVSAWAYDDSLHALSAHGATAGWESIAIAAAAAILLVTALLDARRRTLALVLPLLLLGQLAAMLLPGQYPLVAAAGLAALTAAAAVVWRRPLPGRLDREILGRIGIVAALGIAAAVLLGYETPRMLFHTSHAPAAGLAAAAAASVALVLAALAARATIAPTQRGIDARAVLTYVAGAGILWTLAAAILGAFQLSVDGAVAPAVHDGFQRGHVAVSVAWVMIGLALVVASLRSRHRGLLRAGGIALLFVALGKLFLYDLAFLTAMARAISFIVTGSVLLLAALLLQRFGYSTRAPASS